MNRRRFLTLASVGAAGGILTACGNDPEATNLTPTRIADAINAPTLAANATPPGGEAAGGGGGAGPELTTVDLEAFDMGFKPAEFAIPADTEVTINFNNTGVLPHDFALDKPKAFVSTLLNGGSKESFKINLPAGTYEFYCSQPGHKAAGMHGTITVGGAGGGSAPAGEASPAAGEASPAAGGAPEGGEPAATEASIETEDIKFSTKELTIAANTDVKITVTNKGVLQHDFHVDKLDITSKLLNSGESDTVTVKAAPGTYDYWCTVPGHKEAGMTGKLIVK